MKSTESIITREIDTGWIGDGGSEFVEGWGGLG